MHWRSRPKHRFQQTPDLPRESASCYVIGIHGVAHEFLKGPRTVNMRVGVIGSCLLGFGVQVQGHQRVQSQLGEADSVG